MGKYIRKSKTAGEVAVLEVTNTKSSLGGVRTRAKTLALQRLQKLNNSPATGSGGDGVSYLQLRNRRLIKPLTVIEGRRQKQGGSTKNPNLVYQNPSQKPNLRATSRIRQGSSLNSGSVEKKRLDPEKMEEMIFQENQKEDEASFGENMLEFGGRKRTTRQSTPCSLIRDPDNSQTPGSGSSTRPINASEVYSRVPNVLRMQIPTSHEMDEFFTGSEEQQQRQFIEKYNFDPVNEKPLPGRYEWMKVDC